MTLPRVDQTVRTDEMAHGFDTGVKPRDAAVVRSDDIILDEIDECIPTNLNQGRKRYRTTAENSNDGARAPVENLMGKIRVTQVGCSELSHPVGKHISESVVPPDCQSSFGGEGAKPSPQQ